MIRRIAFIHTVAMLVERFRPRFQSELPDGDCFHMLDESVLQDLIRQGPSSGITRRIVTLAQVAADAGAELIVFTCSSTSPAVLRRMAAGSTSSASSIKRDCFSAPAIKQNASGRTIQMLSPIVCQAINGCFKPSPACARLRRRS
jgi:hypothetical protein